METKHYLKKIMSSDSDSKKNEMVELICEVFEEIEDEDFEEVERRIYEISEGKVLNEEMAQHIISNMKPYGEKWKLADTENVRTTYGYENIKPVDFWIVMNSAYNDYNDIFKEDVSLYARFSRDFIKDEDAVEDKVYYYFSMIPKD